jgi:hypothetical protein
MSKTNQLIASKLRELAELFDGQQQEAPKAQPKVETPKVETPKVETPKVETPKVETPTKATKAHTLDDIRTAMAKLIGSGKRDHALSILSKVGVAKVSEIPEDKFDFVMVAVDDVK